MRRRSGFSLVELSIVLVILGLLVGGILAGQSLIRASELRSVSADFTKFTAATGAFRDKYLALPGDMTNAVDFWGKDTLSCNNATGTFTTPGSTNASINNAVTAGTCNGNGDGSLGGSNDYYRFWQHLSLAGLIDGQYSGRAAYPWSGANYSDVAGLNVPASKYRNQHYAVHGYTGFGIFWIPAAPANGNWLMLGTCCSTTYFWLTQGSTPAGDAWNIDTKLDDGKPFTGKTQVEGVASCTTGSGATAAYKTDESVVTACTLYQHLGF